MKIATFNIDQARHAERITDEQVAAGEFDTRFNNRCPQLVNLINTCGADIICLQELRNLATSKYDVKTFLSMLKYDSQYAYYCEWDESFALATLYDRNKVTIVETSMFHFHDDPQNDKICFGIKFRLNGTKKVEYKDGIKIVKEDVFWVWNTHWAIEENLKWEAANKLRDMLSDLSDPYIVCGDYNLFDDAEGINQRKMLLNYFDDLAYPVENLSGTFLGYNCDKGKRDINNMSRLDHMFSNHLVRTGNARAIGWTLEMLQQRSYPSDHMMIMIDVEISKQQPVDTSSNHSVSTVECAVNGVPSFSPSDISYCGSMYGSTNTHTSSDKKTENDREYYSFYY